MRDSELKLEIIRLIDRQNGKTLNEIYELILSKLRKSEKEHYSSNTFEKGYKEMSKDHEREKDAFEWIEGTLNHDHCE